MGLPCWNGWTANNSGPPADCDVLLDMTGSFFGMFDKEMLSVIAPITGNFNTYGYVVIHMPIEQIVKRESPNCAFS